MLKELINKFYSNRQQDRAQHHFYITDAGRCPRSIFFKFKKAPRAEMEPRILRMFDHGDSIHQLIMKPLFGIREIHVVASEVNIPPQEIISGRADAIISDGKDLYVVDIKSINGMIFNNLKEAKQEHINQIQLYLHYFKQKRGIVLYVNKDTQELKEFFVDYDRNRVEPILKELTLLKEKIGTNVIPQRIPGWPSDWQCKYCQFKEVCSMTGAGELGWDSFKEKIEAINSKKAENTET